MMGSMTTIDRRTGPYVVLGDDPILAALTKISDNKSGIVFCVDARGVLVGSFSDGDFRRWVTSTPAIDLTTPVEQAAHRDAVSLAYGSDPATVAAAGSVGARSACPWP